MGVTVDTRTRGDTLWCGCDGVHAACGTNLERGVLEHELGARLVEVRRDHDHVLGWDAQPQVPTTRQRATGHTYTQSHMRNARFESVACDIAFHPSQCRVNGQRSPRTHPLRKIASARAASLTVV